MQIEKKVEGNKVTVSVTGMINTETANLFNDELLSLDYSDLDLTIDFANTDYITSAGLRVLLIARKKLTEDRMRIINANSLILEVFNTVNFHSIINVISTPVSEEDYRLSIASLLAKRLETGNGRIAYIYKDREYTWQDIEVGSHILADKFAKAGVKKGSHVGICALNSINWLLAFFAIQKLGAIAVLINPALKPNEVNNIAGHSDTTHLCYGEIPGKTTFELYQQACLDGQNVQHMFDISDNIDFAECYNEYLDIKDKYRTTYFADDASVIIFSSGSTGMPKAILSSSYNLLSSVEPLNNGMKMASDDVNLAFLPMFHVFGLATNISAQLLVGYHSVIPDNKTPAGIIELIEKYKCTVFNSVPTMMLAMVQDKSFSPEKLSSLRLSVLGGSATTEEQMNMLRKLMPNNHFGNIYGMSECAAISLTRYEDTIEHITRTIGVPVPDMELVIRDLKSGEVLPTSEKGEICVRSNTMATCYYNLPIENQPLDEEGWLATGDIGMLDEDGYLYIMGRTKEIIISGGENISPGEIAEAIAALPEIADVKVVGVPHEVRGEVVAAAVILKDGSSWNEEAVREKLAGSLAKYKLPTYYAVFESFPLLGSGKVDGLAVKKQIIEKLGL
ncbi:MAG: AMP-binding protein [Bacillota bacterium]|nr:AMP-binding protein [Bacillota bacterium]